MLWTLNETADLISRSAHAGESAAPAGAPLHLAEPDLDGIEPRRAGRCEVQVKARLGGQEVPNQVGRVRAAVVVSIADCIRIARQAASSHLGSSAIRVPTGQMTKNRATPQDARPGRRRHQRDARAAASRRPGPEAREGGSSRLAGEDFACERGDFLASARKRAADRAPAGLTELLLLDLASATADRAHGRRQKRPGGSQAPADSPPSRLYHRRVDTVRVTMDAALPMAPRPGTELGTHNRSRGRRRPRPQQHRQVSYHNACNSR